MLFRDAQFEAQLIARLTANPAGYKLLDADERAYLLEYDLRAECPVCRGQYAIYDRNNDRIRQFCSLPCSNRSRASPDRKWECVICHSRFKNAKGLELHIQAKHPDCDLHDYIRRYYMFKGWDPALLHRFCSVCKRELKLLFAYARYETCPCLNTEKKLFQVERELKGERDPGVRKGLHASRRGCKSLLSKARRSASDEAGKKTLPGKKPARPGGHIVTSLWVKGLNDVGALCAQVKAQYGDVYAAYYSLLEAVTAHGAGSPEAIAVNNNLLEKMKDAGWRPRGNEDGVYLYVWALDSGKLTGNEAPWTHYAVGIGVLPEQYAYLMGKTSCHNQALKKYLEAHPGNFPLPSDHRLQCWHRITVLPNVQPFQLSPEVILRAYNSTRKDGDGQNGG